MSQNIIQSFYEAFKEMNAEKMVSLYHKDVIFEDPAFGVLKGVDAGNMWRMLIESQKGKVFKISFDSIQADATSGSARWEAWYTFNKTGRKVHNSIHATFEFKDGLIIQHTDVFDLYAWSRQALGFQGLLLGWSSFFQRKLQNQTNRMLKKYSAQK